MFTYHKYRKSIDSPVPLDAHGQPVQVGDDRDIALSESVYSLVSERVPLVDADEDHGEAGRLAEGVSSCDSSLT